MKPYVLLFTLIFFLVFVSSPVDAEKDGKKGGKKNGKVEKKEEIKKQSKAGKAQKQPHQHSNKTGKIGEKKRTNKETISTPSNPTTKVVKNPGTSPASTPSNPTTKVVKNPGTSPAITPTDIPVAYQDDTPSTVSSIPPTERVKNQGNSPTAKPTKKIITAQTVNPTEILTAHPTVIWKEKYSTNSPSFDTKDGQGINEDGGFSIIRLINGENYQMIFVLTALLLVLLSMIFSRFGKQSLSDEDLFVKKGEEYILENDIDKLEGEKGGRHKMWQKHRSSFRGIIKVNEDDTMISDCYDEIIT